MSRVKTASSCGAQRAAVLQTRRLYICDRLTTRSTQRANLCYAAGTDTTAGISGKSSRLQWNGPPSSYSLQQTCKLRTRELVTERFGADSPLLRLVEEGTLVMYHRPTTYRERREDGYREPKEIFIVGTSHVSKESAEDVELVVNAVKPDAVIVELCKGRSAVMYQEQGDADQRRRASQPISMTGENLLQAFFRSVALGGTAALVIQLMLSYALRRVIPQDGSISPGLEFKYAYTVRRPSHDMCNSASNNAVLTESEPPQAAEKVDAEIVLGDRPIEITIERCMAALPNQRRWELAKTLVKSVWESRNDKMDAATFNKTMEKLKSEDGVDKAMQMLLNEVPELLQPLIHERDLYLAWSMKRSKAVNGTSQVVGVVGKGHLKGIMWAMENDPHGRIRFRDLTGGRNTKEFKQKQRRKATVDFVRDLVLFGALGWVLHVYGWF